MHDELLDEDKREVLELQAPLVRTQQFFLAGGTGLALRLGHRVSADLDWFTARAFDEKALVDALEQLPTRPTATHLGGGAQTVRAYYGNIETSFIRYAQVRGNAELARVGAVQVPVAELGLIAAMKAAALHDRGAKRDFVDVHALCRSAGWSVERFITHAATVLPLTPQQVAMSLRYFVDAERQPMPHGYKFDWEQIKRDLDAGVRGWERKRELEAGVRAAKNNKRDRGRGR